MKKTLYISDLDGTLLNKEKQVTTASKEALNIFIQQGVQFSIATARTAATVEGLLKSVKINIPVVLMNGVALYDLRKHKYIDIEYVGEKIAEQIIKRLEAANEGGFIYTINEGDLSVYYDKRLNKYENIFYEERKDTKIFIQDRKIDKKKIIYFVFMDNKEKIEEIAKLIKDIEGIAFSLYRDNYMEDAYLLEVYSERASKSNGVLKLKKKYGYEKVVCFGDNLNDLSMFEVADYSCAMSNATYELKAVATEIIASNEEEGVVQFIKRHINQL